MAWIEFSSKYLFATGEVEVVRVLYSLEILMFSLDLERVLVEGDIIRNRILLGLWVALNSIEVHSLGECSCVL